MAFRFCAKRLHLTYAGHLGLDDEPGSLFSFLCGLAEVECYSFVHEKGHAGDNPEDAYDHTHAFVQWKKRVETRNARFFDFNGVHPPPEDHRRPSRYQHLRVVPSQGSHSAQAVRVFPPKETERLWNESGMLHPCGKPFTSLEWKSALLATSNSSEMMSLAHPSSPTSGTTPTGACPFGPISRPSTSGVPPTLARPNGPFTASTTPCRLPYG